MKTNLAWKKDHHCVSFNNTKFSYSAKNIYFNSILIMCLGTKMLLLPPANEVWGKVIFSQACVKNSLHREVVSLHVLQQVSRGRGVVSQHALQVSRPTPGGKFRGIWPGGFSRPTPKGEVEGDQARGRGVSRPTSKGEVEGIWSGRSPGPHLEGSALGVRGLLQGVPGPRVVCVETPPRDGYCCGW